MFRSFSKFQEKKIEKIHTDIKKKKFIWNKKKNYLIVGLLLFYHIIIQFSAKQYP